MSDVTALYPGTFDPFTHGHLDLVRRARRLVGRLVVAVAQEAPRAAFDADTRVRLARAVLDAEGLPGPEITVRPFAGLVVDAAREEQATLLIRGVRGAMDLDYELRMAFANRDLAPGIETTFLPPSPETIRVSGSLVREVARLGGDVSRWVHPAVAQALADRFAQG